MTLTRQQIEDFLYFEARCLDDRQWQQWLECYAPEASFWMPAWDDDGKLTSDPQREISLIYYARREGLEDRVFRIETERSSASTPEPRTQHMISNVEILSQDGGRCQIRFNWSTYSYRYQTLDVYVGTSFYTLSSDGDRPLILDKKVILKNDYIKHVIDVYHI